jgi:hypothetical protein
VEEEGQALLTVKGDEGGNGDQSMGRKEQAENGIILMQFVDVNLIIVMQ